jgi:hypothetical protein
MSYDARFYVEFANTTGRAFDPTSWVDRSIANSILSRLKDEDRLAYERQHKNNSNNQQTDPAILAEIAKLAAENSRLNHQNQQQLDQDRFDREMDAKFQSELVSEQIAETRKLREAIENMHRHRYKIHDRYEFFDEPLSPEFVRFLSQQRQQELVQIAESNRISNATYKAQGKIDELIKQSVITSVSSEVADHDIIWYQNHNLTGYNSYVEIQIQNLNKEKAERHKAKMQKNAQLVNNNIPSHLPSRNKPTDTSFVNSTKFMQILAFIFTCILFISCLASGDLKGIIGIGFLLAAVVNWIVYTNN